MHINLMLPRLEVKGKVSSSRSCRRTIAQIRRPRYASHGRDCLILGLLPVFRVNFNTDHYIYIQPITCSKVAEVNAGIGLPGCWKRNAPRRAYEQRVLSIQPTAVQHSMAPASRQ